MHKELTAGAPCGSDSTARHGSDKDGRRGACGTTRPTSWRAYAHAAVLGQLVPLAQLAMLEALCQWLREQLVRTSICREGSQSASAARWSALHSWRAQLA